MDHGVLYAMWKLSRIDVSLSREVRIEKRLVLLIYLVTFVSDSDWFA